METKKWNFINILLLSLVGFCLADDEVLWDMGMVIKEKEKISQSGSTLNENNTRMNAVRTNPYIPPVRVSQRYSHIKKFNYDFKHIDMISAENKKQIFLDIANCILNKNYLAVIKMLDGTDFSRLSFNDRSDFEYRLADAFFKTGKLAKALDITKVAMNKFKEDRFYMLLAMVYEAQGNKEKARGIYQQIIRDYPNGNYFLTAKIKSRVLTHN